MHHVNVKIQAICSSVTVLDKKGERNVWAAISMQNTDCLVKLMVATCNQRGHPCTACLDGLSHVKL